MSVQQSVRSYLGIAKEATKGTIVAPTDFIPVAKDNIKPVDVVDPLYDTGLRGSNVVNYNYLQGRTRSTFDFGGTSRFSSNNRRFSTLHTHNFAKEQPHIRRR
jgi:hypothetical protein